MTKTEILAIKPGRELDALIAVKVFNWKEEVNDDGIKIYISHSGIRHRVESLPNHSTDIKSALPIMAKMRISVICSEDGWYATVTDDIIHSDVIRRYTYKYKQVYGKHWALADNVPEAICKAALCAVLNRIVGR